MIKNYLITLASLVIILGGVKVASAIVVPFLLALFLAVVLSPLISFFSSKGLARSLSLGLVLLFFVIGFTSLTLLLGASIKDFSSNLPQYNSELKELFSTFFSLASKYGVEVDVNNLISLLDPSLAMSFTAKFLNSMSSIFSNGFVIFLLLIFMLAESEHLTKLLMSKSANSTKHIEEILSKVNQYMVLKSAISLGTGIVVTLCLALLGLDYALLWGVLAFLFNFIPNIGSIIAALPAVLLALIQLGFIESLLTALMFAVVNIVIGSVIEPKVMGRSLGLSSLVVFISLIFWGWLLGLVGMFISIPLTIIVKIMLDSNKDTKWIGDLLGTSSASEVISLDTTSLTSTLKSKYNQLR